MDRHAARFQDDPRNHLVQGSGAGYVFAHAIAIGIQQACLKTRNHSPNAFFSGSAAESGGLL